MEKARLIQESISSEKLFKKDDEESKSVQSQALLKQNLTLNKNTVNVAKLEKLYGRDGAPYSSGFSNDD